MTIITFPVSDVRQAHPHVRRFDVRRDLSAVADLVEQSFSETLDLDGRRYIQHMRRTAMHPRFLKWAAGMSERASFPFSGFVWEEGGEVIGNLSLIPMQARGERTYLIANVAVENAHRRHGIARILTETALEDCRRRGVDRVWLHVREDNPSAIDLYRKLFFVERARRTSWYSSPEQPEAAPAPGIRIASPRRRHWPRQRAWFELQHPPELGWYLTMKARLLQPGLSGMLARVFSGASIRQWAVLRGGELLAALAWQRTYSAADRLWLAAPNDFDPDAVCLLIEHARRSLPTRKTLHLEYPAGQATGVFERAGFRAHQTLIWMQSGA